ncbi:hypothetical protein ACLBYD_29040 [Rhodococcus sp. C26F]
MIRWPWRKKRRQDPVEVTRAQAELALTEQQLMEAKARWTEIHDLSQKVDTALKVNGFGAAASAAMRRRHA